MFESKNYENDFLAAMSNAGILCREKIIADGKIHRFSAGNRSKKNGWYVCHGNYGSFGDWSENFSMKWSDGNADICDVTVQKKIQETKERQNRQWQDGAEKATKHWNKFQSEGHSEYLDRKQIRGLRIKFRRDSIIIPLRDIDGKLWSYQTISGGGKWFMSGGKVRGCFHTIGAFKPNGHVYIAEGYATAATVHMATGSAVIVAFNVGNLKAVIAPLSSHYPDLYITIAADNDLWKAQNIGKDTAYKLSDEFGCNVVLPKFTILDGQPTDFNDLHVLEGIEEVTEQLELHYV